MRFLLVLAMVGFALETVGSEIVRVDSGTGRADFVLEKVDSAIEMVGFVLEKVGFVTVMVLSKEKLPSMGQLLKVVEIEKERGEAYQTVQVCHLSVVRHIIERAGAKSR